MTTPNEDVQREIGENVGIPFSELIDMDWDEIDRRIERKNGKELSFQRQQDDRLPTRGSVFLMLGRLISREYIQSRLDGLRRISVGN